MAEQPNEQTQAPAEQSVEKQQPSNDYFALPDSDNIKELKKEDSKDKLERKNLMTANQTGTGVNERRKNDKKKKKKVKREKMKDGELVKSETFLWKVIRLLGSGGFGDVYKVAKLENLDKREYAMKTEMVEGDKRMLRLKIEVTVLKQCHECPDESRRKTFVEFIDRGITEKFKFLVMGLIGPSLEDIRKEYLLRNYSRSTAMIAALQTLKAVANLHYIGWLHRDIKPANYAVGLGDREDTIYMLDFGIARKIFKDESKKEIKPARTKVKFLGTLRFASRACHHGIEQGRKDDLETWLYMAFDLLDENGLPWKRTGDKRNVIGMKEKFFTHSFPKCYKIVPKEFRKIVDYINGLSYGHEPDYLFIEQAIQAICRDHSIDIVKKKLDWIGKLKKKPEASSSSSATSSDNRQSGSESSDSEKKKKVGRKRNSKGGMTKEGKKPQKNKK